MYKISFLFFFSLLFTTTYAQKSKVLSTYKYTQAYLTNLKCNELAKAKEAGDLAVKDESTGQWAKAWFYRGEVYYYIHTISDSACNRLDDESLDKAYDSFRKALKMDEKKRYEQKIHPKLAVISSYYMQQGADYFNKENFLASLRSFEKCNEVAGVFGKVDSLALYNAALSAEQVKNYDKAILYYSGLIDINYGGAKIYHFLKVAYEKAGNDEKAHETVMAGRKAYPNDEALIIDEIDYYLTNNKNQEALKSLENAINLTPDNHILHYAQATVYDKLKETELAEASYKRTLELDANYFDATYNLGALYFNKGVEILDEANNLPESKTNLFKEKKAQATKSFKSALPHLEKARELRPDDKPTLESLKKLYSLTGNDAAYEDVRQALEN